MQVARGARAARRVVDGPTASAAEFGNRARDSGKSAALLGYASRHPFHERRSRHVTPARLTVDERGDPRVESQAGALRAGRKHG